jgi:hypothetical protein
VRAARGGLVGLRAWRHGGWRLLVIDVVTFVVFVALILALSTTPLVPAGILWGPAGVDPGLHRIRAGGEDLPVFVTPQRPGWNLVMLPGEQGSVGTHPQRLVPAASRPGGRGSWALVELPEGAAQLWVRQDGVLAELTVRTASGTPLDIRGPDGPECATAQLGRALAGAPALDYCPADRLLGADSAALRATVRFIAGRGDRALTLVADRSARSLAAAEVVRSAAAAEGVAVHVPGPARGPVVVVAGWEKTESILYDIAAGRLATEATYLAPWLLSPPLLLVPAGQLLALPFSPTGDLARRYAAAQAQAFTGAAPTASGFAGWLSAQGIEGWDASTSVRLYAPAMFNAALLANAGGGGHDHGSPDEPADWLPGGRLTAVTGELDGNRHD